jgi:hypothetical protein
MDIVKIWIEELKKKWYSERSKAWRLNARDFIQGLILAVIAGALSAVYTAYASDGVIDWELVKKSAIIAITAYVIKKFPQGEK